MRPLRVGVRNVRGAHDVELHLRPFSALIGPNNAGKSTLLDAVRLFYDVLAWDGPRDRTWSAQPTEASWVEISYELNEQEANDILGVTNEDREHGAELLDDDVLTVRRYLVDHDGHRAGQYYFVPANGDELEATGWSEVSNKFGQCVYVPTLAQVRDHTAVTRSSPFRDILMLAFSEPKIDVYLSAVTSGLQGIRQIMGEGPVSNLEDELDQALHSWGLSTKVHIGEITSDFIVQNLIDLRLTQDGEERSADAQGSGVQRALIAGLIQAAARVRQHSEENAFRWILFEEPEALLHPAQITRLAQDLRQLTKTGNTAVTITTHAPATLSASETSPEGITRVQRHGAQIQVTSPAPPTVTRALDAIHVRSTYTQASHSCFKKPRMTGPDEERSRILYDLDVRRAAAFFAERVIVVEGISDVAFFEWLERRGHLARIGPNVGIMDTGGKYELHRAVATLSLFHIPHVVVWDEDAAMQQPGTNEHVNQRCRDDAALQALRGAACDPGSSFAGALRLPGTIERWLGITEEKTGAWKAANLGAAMTESYALPGSLLPGKVEALLSLIEGLFDKSDLAQYRAHPDFVGALIDHELSPPTLDLAAVVAQIPRNSCACKSSP
ncbi:AAA family ATPase [Nonomuraea sp. NPDC003804]|uniref:AAA family ATPase n=1 Tax=Nonomuraea sp. NPDC003804 TaxID=3154547 RepID=UPI0033AD7CC2